MNIVILDGYLTNPGDLSWAPLESHGAVALYQDSTPEEMITRLQGAEVAISNRVSYTPALFDACPGLRYIGLCATGYNTVPLEAASAHGITVTNVPGYSTMGVAQHTMALLLEAANQVAALDADVHVGRWSAPDWNYLAHPLRELDGKTFGAIGFGSIGRAAGRMAAAFGMKVLATGSRPVPEGQAIAEYVDLDTLLARSDVVSMHCPLLPETRGIINAGTIARMKPGAIFLNTARGALVDGDALADALNRGRLAFAGLDVTPVEPIPSDSPLFAAKNCRITPHVAWAAAETRERLIGMVADNLGAWLAGRPTNVVNP